MFVNAHSMSRFVDSVSGFRFKLDILYEKCISVNKMKHRTDKAQLTV
jgi:hypothetical protein